MNTREIILSLALLTSQVFAMEAKAFHRSGSEDAVTPLETLAQTSILTDEFVSHLDIIDLQILSWTSKIFNQRLSEVLVEARNIPRIFSEFSASNPEKRVVLKEIIRKICKDPDFDLNDPCMDDLFKVVAHEKVECPSILHDMMYFPSLMKPLIDHLSPDNEVRLSLIPQCIEYEKILPKLCLNKTSAEGILEFMIDHPGLKAEHFHLLERFVYQFPQPQALELLRSGKITEDLFNCDNDLLSLFLALRNVKNQADLEIMKQIISKSSSKENFAGLFPLCLKFDIDQQVLESIIYHILDVETAVIDKVHFKNSMVKSILSHNLHRELYEVVRGEAEVSKVRSILKKLQRSDFDSADFESLILGFEVAIFDGEDSDLLIKIIKTVSELGDDSRDQFNCEHTIMLCLISDQPFEVLQQILCMGNKPYDLQNAIKIVRTTYNQMDFKDYAKLNLTDEQTIDFVIQKFHSYFLKSNGHEIFTDETFAKVIEKTRPLHDDTHFQVKNCFVGFMKKSLWAYFNLFFEQEIDICDDERDPRINSFCPREAKKFFNSMPLDKLSKIEDMCLKDNSVFFSVGKKVYADRLENENL